MATIFWLWSPDICPCEIFHARDDTQPDDVRTYFHVTTAEAQVLADAITDAQGKPRRVQPAEKMCQAHQALGLTDALTTVLVAENRTLSYTLPVLIGIRSDIIYENIKWEFDGQRLLVIRFEGVVLTVAEKATMQAALNIQFGPNKVLVT